MASRKRKAAPVVTVSMELWTALKSEQHPRKAQATGGENADRCAVNPRAMGVFDGVSGVEAPWAPKHMAMAMCAGFQRELIQRFTASGSAQRYDEGVRTELALPRGQEPGSWLQNMMTYAFANVQTGGSTTFSVATFTKGLLTYCCLGDCRVAVYRFDAVLGRAQRFLGHTSTSNFVFGPYIEFKFRF